MPSEQSGQTEESALPARPRAESDRGDSYELLVGRYGEAMLRIGRLEAQIERLTGELRSRPDLADDTVPAPGRGGTQGASPSPRHAPPAVEEHLERLALEIADLSTKLAQTEGELAIVRGESARRHGRRRKRDRGGAVWWRLWRRRSESD